MSKYAGKIVTNQAPAGYSVFFDGSGDYLSVASNAAFGFGTGDFTVEFWVNLPSASTTQVFFDNRIVTGLGLVIYSNAGTLTVNFNNTGGVLITGGALTSNTWTHIALARASGSSRLFINGTQSGSTAADSNNYPTNATYIGGNFSAGQLTTGYISNVRIIKGTALYTANFTPPTQLFNVTNTSLLTCNSPAIVDQSSNAFAITVNGNAAVSTFTPFPAYVPYNPALGASTPGVWTLDEAMQAAATRQWNMYDPYFQNTTLLLHGNGTNAAQNNTFLDSSSNNFTITRNGNTTQGSFSPFSQAPGAWSGYFDGSGDYLSIADNAALDLGAGDFCVEAFVYPTGDVAYSGIAGKNNGSGDGWFLEYSATRGLIAIWETSNSVSSATAYTKNSWQHIVFCRSGSTVSLYKDGIRLSTTTSTATIAFAAACTIGVAAGGGVFPGYISNARIVKGSSPYNAALSTLTVPTAPLTAITNTQLLTCQSSRFVDNSSNAFAITLLGDTSVQAFSPFYPTAAYTPATIGGSGYFDGTGDYLLTQASSALVAAGDFTVEAWFYCTQTGAYQGIIASTDGADTAGFRIAIDNTNVLGFWINGQVNTSTAVVFNQWNHVAMVRSGTASNNVSCYLNGARIAQLTNTASTTNNTVAIGRYRTTGTDQYWIKGFIASARLVVGSALYSGTTYTIPTAPLTAITNTQLLLNYTNAGVIDSTAKNVLETVGNAQISTTQSKFGGSSMYFDGTGDYAYAVSSAANSALGSGDWTVEFWLYTNAGSTTYNVIDWRPNATQGNYFSFYLNSGVPTYYTNSANRITGGSAIPATTWTHVAISRSGTSTRMFINGTQSGSTYTDSANYLGVVNRPAIGGGGSDTNNTLNGYIDDLRVTRGYARYTSNFTPQTSQWQDQ